MLTLDRKLIDAKTLIKRTLDAIQSQADSKGIFIITRFPELEILCDEDRIVQVMINLVANSLKFSARESQIQVDIAEAEDAVEFKVVDQGKGIPEDKIDSLFERYVQVEHSDQSVHGGSGLGLAICKALVHAHGGEIGVRSTPNVGSEFWFRLPKLSA